MSKLQIATNLSLPADAVTQAIGVLAKRRAGKSYTARRITEQLYKAGQQVVIVDPKGDWWGIRSAADGKSPGLPIVILGGERGDIPLEVGNGEVVAKLVAEERVSVLLDLSLFRKHEVATFMTSFLENLYRLKAREINRTPLMLVIDEADAIAPQRPAENEARMLGAAEDIVRRGGQRGIGCMMITQRSAVLNKNVLTQVEVLVALRTIAPQDLKAMDAWIEVHGEKEQRDTLMGSLPSLPVGDAWFWSPGWPTKDGIFTRVSVLPIETFDSGATPKPGEKRVEPKNLADVDLDALTKQMASTIEKAKADDPKELRKKIGHLEREIREFRNSKPAAPVVDHSAIQKAVDKAVATESRRWQSRHNSIAKKLEGIANMSERVHTSLRDLVGEIQANELRDLNREPDAKAEALVAPKRPSRNPASSVVSESGRVPEHRSVGHARRDSRERPATIASNGNLSRGQQKILNALAEFEAIGVEQTTRHQLGMMAGYNLTGGSGAQHIADLVAAGLAEIPNTGLVRLTNNGRAAAVAEDAPTTLAELHERVLRKLSQGQRRIAEYLIEIYPDSISRAELGAAVGYNLTGGSGAQHVADLVTVGAARIPGSGKVVASDLLFPDGLN